jgi:hypothetical protein
MALFPISGVRHTRRSLMVEMAHSMSVSQFRSEFDDFLYASVEEGGNGTLLSVLSALARLDIDPWQEAANLAQMSRASATRRLAGLIAALPVQSLAHRDSGIIAVRLIALLPEKASFSPASREASPNAGALNNSRALMYVIILNVMFMAITFGSQYFAANRQPAAQVGHAHALVASKAAPKVPPADFGK